MKNILWALLFYFIVPITTSMCFAEQIVVWHQKDGATPLLEKLLTPVADAYSADLSVTYISTTDLKTALIKSVLNKSEPNLALIPSDFFGEYATLKLSPVSELMKQKAQVEGKLWDFVKVNDVEYGIPLAVGNHLVMYYNKNLVEEPIDNWQQLIELSQTEDKTKQMIGWNYSELLWFINFIPLFGGMPVETNSITLNQPSVSDALEFYTKLARANVVDNRCAYECSFQRFIDGDFAYTINGDWAFKAFKAELGDALGVKSLPEHNGRPMKSFYSAIAMIFPGNQRSTSENEINQKLAEALMSQRAQKLLFETTGLLPADKNLRNQLLEKEDNEYEVIIDSIDNGLMLPSTPQMSAAWAGLRKGFDYFSSNDVKSERATRIMQQVAERQLATLQKH
jgi:maltose-binding protein MalE